MILPIVFAAGLGTRMGAIKALVPIEGEPALTVVLKTIESAGLRCPVVVLGRDAEAIRSSVDLADCQIVINNHPERGLSGSMKLALSVVGDTDSGILTFHADMPYLSVSTVRALLDAIGKGVLLAAPFHGSVRGFPVYFARGLLDELNRSLQGDSGGRQFIAQHSKQLVHVPVEDPGCIFDIDRPSDLSAWKGERLCATNE